MVSKYFYRCTSVGTIGRHLHARMFEPLCRHTRQPARPDFFLLAASRTRERCVHACATVSDEHQRETRYASCRSPHASTVPRLPACDGARHPSVSLPCIRQDGKFDDDGAASRSRTGAVATMRQSHIYMRSKPSCSLRLRTRRRQPMIEPGPRQVGVCTGLSD